MKKFLKSNLKLPPLAVMSLALVGALILPGCAPVVVRNVEESGEGARL